MGTQQQPSTPLAASGWREELVAAFELTRKLAPLNGAVGWYDDVVRMDADQREQYALPVPALLQELLDHLTR